MGGRDLTRGEWLWRELPDVPAWQLVCSFVATTAAFFRWAWLRLTGKTACRFSPMYETKILPWGDVRQANGLHLPYQWKKPETCDWRAALLEQLEKLDKE